MRAHKTQGQQARNHRDYRSHGKGRQKVSARFAQYSYILLAYLQVCIILHVFLSQGSSLPTQKLCTFLGWYTDVLGVKHKACRACRNRACVSIYNNSKRLSLTHLCKYTQDLQLMPRTKETRRPQRERQCVSSRWCFRLAQTF